MATKGPLDERLGLIIFAQDQSSKFIFADIYLPRVHAQGVKQSVCPSVVVGTKIARSRILGIYACCKHNQSVDIGKKLVYTCFKLLKKAY